MSQPAASQKLHAIPELLAPAGSPEAFRAAVAAGADAIYLSGKRFGARKFAANFTDTEIEEAVRYAHTHGIRIYVTVNTLIHDRELSAVTEYLVWLYSIGVDAVLVQDIGLAAIARDLVPGLVLHASTQLTIHNTAGVRWAASQGFRRVVLARELELDEIRKIADETKDLGIGLEVFAHGALCYSYSGQCLLSSVIGGRSGNRGMCAQPCRKPFALVTGPADAYGNPGELREIALKDRYLISPKDLCTYPRLADLLQTPLASLKIEGRMKSPEYVATVVSTYRRAMDAIARGPWKPSQEAVRDLLLAFNRGFTAGYILKDRHDRLMGRDAPDNRGLLLGTVSRYDRAGSLASISVTAPYTPVPGDGFFIRSPDRKEETGFALNTKPEMHKGLLMLRVPAPVRPGSEVYVTSSLDLFTRARQIVAKPPPDLLRPLPVDLAVEVGPNGTIAFRGSVHKPDGSSVAIAYTPDLVLEEARSKPLTAAMLEQQLGKTGGTPFVLRNLAVTCSGDRFAPVAEINRIRREFMAAAEEQLVDSFRPAIHEVRRAQHRWQETFSSRTVPGNPAQTGVTPEKLRLGIYVDSLKGVQAAAAAGADTIFFEPDLRLPRERCDGGCRPASPAGRLGKARAICSHTGSMLAWKLPRITRDPDLEIILASLPAALDAGIGTCMVENTGTAMAVRDAAPTLRLSGAAGLNIFNHAAVRALSPDFSSLTLSPELSRDEIVLLMNMLRKDGTSTGSALVVQGSGEAMITEDCIRRLDRPCGTGTAAGNAEDRTQFLGLRDETGHTFPVRTGAGCRTIIGNARELSLIDHLPSIRAAGIGEVVIDARGRTPAYAGKMTELYKIALTLTNEGPGDGRNVTIPPALKEAVKHCSLGGITTGHFTKGLRE